MKQHKYTLLLSVLKPRVASSKTKQKAARFKHMNQPSGTHSHKVALLYNMYGAEQRMLFASYRRQHSRAEEGRGRGTCVLIADHGRTKRWSGRWSRRGTSPRAPGCRRRQTGLVTTGGMGAAGPRYGLCWTEAPRRC